MPAGKKKIVGLKKWLKEHNRTAEEMQKYWDELISINVKVKALHDAGLNWDETNLSILADLPYAKERTLKYLEECRIKEEQEKAEKEAKIKAEKEYKENFESIMVKKIDTGEKLTEKELRTLTWDYEVEREYGENRRWTRSVYSVCKLCGRFFMTVWEQGLTESQENEYCNQPYEVEMYEYEKVITVKEWRKKS